MEFWHLEIHNSKIRSNHNNPDQHSQLAPHYYLAISVLYPELHLSVQIIYLKLS